MSIKYGAIVPKDKHTKVKPISETVKVFVEEFGIYAMKKTTLDKKTLVVVIVTMENFLRERWNF